MYTARNTVQGDALLVQYALTRSIELRDRIVECYLYIAEIVARKFSGRGVDYDDLYQVAALALVKGVERFDAEKGVKFASFITPTMVGEVKNYFRDRSRTIRLPRRAAQLARELRETKNILEQKLGRSPKVSELAESMGLSDAEVLEAMELGNAMTPASLDAQVVRMTTARPPFPPSWGSMTPDIPILNETICLSAPSPRWTPVSGP